MRFSPEETGQHYRDENTGLRSALPEQQQQEEEEEDDPLYEPWLAEEEESVPQEEIECTYEETRGELYPADSRDSQSSQGKDDHRVPLEERRSGGTRFQRLQRRFAGTVPARAGRRSMDQNDAPLPLDEPRQSRGKRGLYDENSSKRANDRGRVEAGPKRMKVMVLGAAMTLRIRKVRAMVSPGSGWFVACHPCPFSFLVLV